MARQLHQPHSLGAATAECGSQAVRSHGAGHLLVNDVGVNARVLALGHVLTAAFFFVWTAFPFVGLLLGFVVVAFVGIRNASGVRTRNLAEHWQTIAENCWRRMALLLFGVGVASLVVLRMVQIADGARWPRAESGLEQWGVLPFTLWTPLVCLVDGAWRHA